MQRHRSITKFVLAFSAMLLAVTFASLGFAQEAPKPQLSRVLVTQVKPEMWEQFLEFYKNETLPALRKAGVKQSLVLQSSGPIGNSFEFRVVQSIDNLAQFDEGSQMAKAIGPEKWKAYQAKRRAMITGQRAYIIRSIPEVAIPVTGTDKILVRREIIVAAGRRADYENDLKEVQAVLKRAGSKGHRVSRLLLGGDLNTYFTVDSYDSFAEYEKFIAELPKVESYSNLAGQTAGIVTHTNISVYTTIQELSIIPAPVASAGK